MRNEVLGKIIIVSLLLGWGFKTLTLTIGSFTAPSRQARPSFSGAGNIIQGFAALDSGFGFADAATGCLFNAYYPISTTLTFNGGNLQLSKNLVLSSNASIPNAGIIGGNNYQIDLPDTISTFTLPAMTLGNIKLVFHSNVVLSGTTTFTGTNSIEGNGYTLDCVSGGFTLSANAALSMTDIVLKNVSGTKLACTDNTGTYTCINTTWILSDDYSFNQGRFAVLGAWDIAGGKVFTYASTHTIMIYSNAMMLFDQGMTFSYAPSNSSQDLISFANASAILHLYETTWYVKSSGIKLTQGTVVFEGRCPIASQATSSENGVLLGDGISASNNIHIQELPGSGPYLASGFLVNNNV